MPTRLRTRWIRSAAASAGVLISLALPATAAAVDHLIKLREVFAGTPTASTASTATVVGGVAQLEAAAGVANNVTMVRSTSASLRFRDAAAPIHAGAGCTQLLTNEVRCSAAGITASIDAGDGNDQVRPFENSQAWATDTTVDGGPGADRITTTNGDDILIGGSENDTLSPGTGTDTVDGGPGADTASYSPRHQFAPVTVDLDSVADDGNADDENASGDRDNILATVERLVGGDGRDRLFGNDFANHLTGGRGRDRLVSRGGNDTIFAQGDGFDDSINCGGGPSDRVLADPVDIYPTTGSGACELTG